MSTRDDEWVELPGYPRQYASRSAPWGSAARIVRGEIESKNGKPVILSGTRAFAQRLEGALIEAFGADGDIGAVVGRVLEAHAQHLDSVEWCRHRGSDLDLACRIYGSRGATRLYLSLRGPVGAYADQDPPPRASPKKAKGKAPPPAPSAVREVTASPPSAAAARPAPAAPLWLCPIAEGATPSYVSPIAFEPDGLIVVCLRLPRGAGGAGYDLATVDPDGSVEVEPLASRDALRVEDPAAMTDAILPSVHATGRGVVRVEHVERPGGMRERVRLDDGRWSSDRALSGVVREVGRIGSLFVRLVALPEPRLVAVDLTSGKRSRAALAPGGAPLDVAVGETDDELRVLRVADGGSRVLERYRLRARPKLELELLSATPISLGEGAAIGLVPSRQAMVVARGRALALAGADGAPSPIFELPARFVGDDFAPWGLPRVDALGGGRFLASVDLGSDTGGRCRGAVLFDDRGRVLQSLHLDAAGALWDATSTAPLVEGTFSLVGAAGGPHGELAVLLHRNGGPLAVYRTGSAGG